MARSKYLFVASMDVDPSKEALFNEVYNVEHCPELGKVPGVGQIARYEADSFKVMIGGETRIMAPDGRPRFHAVYEIESPDVADFGGMERGGGAGPLAGAGAPLHHQPPPHPAAPDVSGGVSAAG